MGSYAARVLQWLFSSRGRARSQLTTQHFSDQALDATQLQTLSTLNFREGSEINIAGHESASGAAAFAAYHRAGKSCSSFDHYILTATHQASVKTKGIMATEEDTPQKFIDPSKTDSERSSFLLDAQSKALALFSEIEKTLIRPGVSEKELSKEIHELGTARFGVRTHWHKRVVRSGPNTLQPYAENPPDRVIEEDDILFVDLGPVFEAWEADFGRTYVLGNDATKLRLRDTLEPVWQEVKAEYLKQADTITGEELYDLACAASKRAGWEFGGTIAGHIVGVFPHERIPDNMVTTYIKPGNKDKLERKGRDGLRTHWILEIHLVDKEKQIGGFMEQLLTID